MRKMDKQQTYARFSFPTPYGTALILDAKDAAAMLEILARAGVFVPMDQDRYDRTKNVMEPSPDTVTIDLIPASRVRFAAPSLGEAIADALQELPE
jgi:hypothetical protein